MTQPRLHVLRNIRPAISATYWALLNDEPLPIPHNRWEEFTGVAALWPLFRDDILVNWIAAKPGGRPSCWWAYDAPEPRRRLGGKGTPRHDALAYSPDYERGIPASWLSASNIAFYAKGDDFPYDPFDPNDRPVFESEANYLRRLKLFAPGEARRIKKSQYTPETITWRPHNEND